MGGRRHRARETALKVLYANEFVHDDPPEIARRLGVAMHGEGDAGEAVFFRREHWTAFAKELAGATVAQREELDAEISSVLEHWRIERLSRVDLLILRLALCEMRAFDDIPIRVTLNEYIELAKAYGTDESSGFVNGILDRLSKSFADKDFDQRSRAG